MSLVGKTALIAGGCKNLGALVAIQFANEGANLALHYNSASTKASAGRTLASISQLHPNIKVKIFQADLTNAGNVQQLFADAIREVGPIDIVVNTVGMVLKKSLTDITEEEYDQMFAVNSKAAFFITQEAAKHVTDGGKIVNVVTSLLAAYTPFYTSYQGSKAPVEWFTKGLSKEFDAARHQCQCSRSGPDGHAIFLPAGRG